jgi:hypothetical protein
VKVSLPTFEVAGINADGLLNQSEAEPAIPGLKFSANGFAAARDWSFEFAYALILKTSGLREKT